MCKVTEQMAIEKIKAEACSDKLLSVHCDDSCLYGAEKCEWAVAIQALEEIQQLRKIGTIEEYKDLKEKNIAKKPIKVDSGVYDYPYDYECPNCRKNVDETDHHCKCGQRLNWNEEKR